MKKKILLISTGGTLASVQSEKGLIPGLSRHEILEALHFVSQEAEIEVEDFLSRDSANIFPEDWAALADRIGDACTKYDGIVIIHGTDTLAYTASMLSFMLSNIPIPVVITGSQLPLSHPVADAPENCRCAIQMAACGYPGVFVAFNRKVMLGCRASKVNSLSFDAFESINYPYAAEISSLGLHVNKEALPAPRGEFCLAPGYSEKVFVLKLYPGIRAEMLADLYEKGYRGIYIEGYGLGGVPFLKHDFVTAIEAATKKGMAIVIGTQCRYEGSNLLVYETGYRAVESGALQAHDMTAEAAVTKLMWVLGQTHDRDEIRQYFAQSLAGEVCIPEAIENKG